MASSQAANANRRAVVIAPSTSRYTSPLISRQNILCERCPVRSRIVRFCLIALVARTPHAYAQFETAAVTGTVRDATGAVVPNATVTLTNTETGVSNIKTTNGEGIYEFVTVKAGIYLVS